MKQIYKNRYVNEAGSHCVSQKKGSKSGKSSPIFMINYKTRIK